VKESTEVTTMPAVINWWYDAPSGPVRMQSTGPNGLVTANFGAANMVATTPANSDLAAMFGGTTNRFALNQQFNAFALAMTTATK